MQCKIILLKIVITLSNILFVKAEQCDERMILYDEFDTSPKIITCYLDINCTTTIWNEYTRSTHTDLTRTIRCCSGYEQYIINGRSYCMPKCNYRCENGICTGPNTCTCFYGYDKSSIHQAVCIPNIHNCNPRCIRGKCIAPNTCQCNSGYEKSVNNKNRCDCKSGFKITRGGECIPDCVPKCDNGECIGPNNCRCSLGYQRTAQNTCKLICKKKCIHGYCMDGNCICEDEWFGPNCNSTITQNYKHDLHHRFPIEIGLSFTVLVLAGIIFLLHKKRMFHCQRETHNSDLDNSMVNNSIYGSVPK